MTQSTTLVGAGNGGLPKGVFTDYLKKDRRKDRSTIVMAKPLVSVVIPVYNAGEYLRSSLQSILAQTYSNLEILIVNDGSTDGYMDTIADIKDSRIRILNQENAGRASAMNHGLEEMTGDFYIAQDADDISYPCRIEHQVKYLLNAPDIAGVFAGHDLLIGEKVMAPRFAAKNAEECRRDINRFCMPGIGATAMYRVSKISRIRFEPTLKVAEDIDYILRIGERYLLAVLDECLYTYRIHHGSSTRKDFTRNQIMVNRVIERARQRRGLDASNFSFRRVTSDKQYRIRETGVIPHFVESVLDLRRSGRNWQSLTTALACLRLHPLDPYYYKPLLYVLLPMALIRYYRAMRSKLQ